MLVEDTTKRNNENSYSFSLAQPVLNEMARVLLTVYIHIANVSR